MASFLLLAEVYPKTSQLQGVKARKYGPPKVMDPRKFAALLHGGCRERGHTNHDFLDNKTLVGGFNHLEKY